MTYTVPVPSNGLFNGVPRVRVSSIYLGDYIDMLSSRNCFRVGTLVLEKCVGDASVLRDMPMVDREYVATNIFMEDFSAKAMFDMKCPACGSAFKEEFVFGEYETKFLENDDMRLFKYMLNGRMVKFVLPTEPHKDFSFRHYLHPEHFEDDFSGPESDELDSFVMSNIVLAVGIMRHTIFSCAECGFDILYRKPTGLDVLNGKDAESIAKEKAALFTALNSFANGSHQPMGGLLGLTYANMSMMSESLREIKEQEAKAFGK